METQQEGGWAVDEKQLILHKLHIYIWCVLPAAVYGQAPNGRGVDQEPRKSKVALGCSWLPRGELRPGQTLGTSMGGSEAPAVSYQIWMCLF